MRKCWAQSLGNCNDISGEHVISSSAVPSSSVTVLGFPWCPTQRKEIGLASLTANVLCRYHNSALSPSDSEAGKFLDALQQSSALARSRRNAKWNPWPIVRFKINGNLVERWFLKTLVNLSFAQKLSSSDEVDAFVQPTERLARFAFGLEPLSGQLGLYAAGSPGMLTETDHISSIVHLNNGKVDLGMFSFWGPRFILNLAETGVPKDLSYSSSAVQENWSGFESIRHLKSIRETVRNHQSHNIEFVWEDSK